MPATADSPSITPLANGSVGGSALAARVTQRDIAHAAGVHNSTVSLALRDSPTLPQATREKIRHLAARMGYTPVPAVQALVAYRKRLVRRGTTGTIAYVAGGRSESVWRNNPAAQACLLGAQARAAELGYRLDYFWTEETGLTQRRLNQVLLHRGITGVLLDTQYGLRDDWRDFDWQRHSVVAIGNRAVSPPIHRVSTDPEGNVRMVFQRIATGGHRRVGIILPEIWDAAHDGAWSRAFAAAQTEAPPADRLPILVQYPHGQAKDRRQVLLSREREPEFTTFGRWLLRHNPDVLVGWLDHVQPHFDEAGLQVPRDIPFIDMGRGEFPVPVPGVDQNFRATGATAIELLEHQLQNNRRGVPPVPTRTIVEGVWREGTEYWSPDRGLSLAMACAELQTTDD